MYAIVSTGGKQYRVEQGQSLLVERLAVEDGGDATLRPLLFVDGDTVVDGEDLAKVTVQARVVGHERGPKLRVVKFKPKRGYKRRTGHRQDLTRIEITEIKLASRRAPSRGAPKPVAADEAQTRISEGASSAETPSGSEAPATRARRAPAAESSEGESQAKPARRRSSAQPEGADAETKPARPRPKQTASDPEEEGSGS